MRSASSLSKGGAGSRLENAARSGYESRDLDARSSGRAGAKSV